MVPFLFGLIFSSYGQKDVSGKYHNYFSSELILNTDSSYYYSYHFDLCSSWSSGKWTYKNDTILLMYIPVYDTLMYYDSTNNKTIDTLVLSNDSKTNQISFNEWLLNELSSGGQNRVSNPTRLLYRKTRLYEIQENGQLKDKKIYCPFRQKKFEAYYIKQ
jgi:hypothetical protein